MTKFEKGSDRYLRRSYTECQCDKFSLSVPSFRQWFKDQFPENVWVLDTMSSTQYSIFWWMYTNFVNNLRGKW